MPRPSAILLVLLLFAVPTTSKDKKKETLPELMLRARFVTVMVSPDSGISLIDPTDNRIAQSDVEAALQKWGRFNVTTETLNADLIIVVRKGGKAIKPTLNGGTRNDHPVVINPGATGDIGIGLKMGTPPNTTAADSHRTERPTLGTDIGPTEDVFAVYRAGVDNPLDSGPLWRYAGHNGLQHPSVPAVEKFRKAIEEAEKAKP